MEVWKEWINLIKWVDWSPPGTSSQFFFKCYFQLEDNCFTILWWFLPYIDMNQPWMYVCLTILNPPPTSLPTPSLWVVPEHQLWVPCFMHQTHWSSILHMVIYMFQYYSLNSSYPRLLPQSPKICSLHLCLFFCLAYKVVVIVFLNSIYICVSILYWCFPFWLTSLLHNRLQFHPPH